MFFFKPKGGMYREFQGIKMIAEPKDISLYRSLLPEQFSMPKHPSVFFFIADYLKVATWPFKILPWRMTRYQEGAVFLRSLFKQEEGWFCLTMPISSWPSMAPGRYFLGFPKYVVNKITLEKKDDNWHGIINYKNKQILGLKFEPGIKRNLNPWEKQILDKEAFFEDFAYLLYPAEKGPTINKVCLKEVIPSQWSPELGMVEVNISPDTFWADLIATDTPYPGMYNYFIGSNNLISERLN